MLCLIQAHQAQLSALREAQEAREAQRQVEDKLASCHSKQGLDSSVLQGQLSDSEVSEILHSPYKYVLLSNCSHDE